MYVHSSASWGAVGYKTIEMLDPMARPGAVTASFRGLEILTGTFGMAPVCVRERERERECM
jgi:hypothetical protein